LRTPSSGNDLAVRAKNVGSGLFRAFGTLSQALSFAYPDTFLWDHNKFSSRVKKSSQRLLHVLMIDILMSRGMSGTILDNFLHPTLFWGKLESNWLFLKYPDDNRKQRMELDLWVPAHNLALEYQGIPKHDRFLS
jgi:hypothetical protein